MTKINKLGSMPPQRTWGLLTIYWTIGWIIGLYNNYLSYWSMPSVTLLNITALASTLVLQHHINAPLEKVGRRTDYVTVACFAVGNGLAGTMFFLASYDYGRNVLAHRMGLNINQAVAMGYWTHCVYRALLGFAFRTPNVLPRHVKLNAPSFLTHTLPAQLMRSMVWLALYELHGDVAAICLLHIVSDAWWASEIALPSIFAT